MPAAATPQYPYDLNYVLYGNANNDPALAGVRRQVFDDNLLVLTIDGNSPNGVMTFNNGHPIGDFPLVTQQLLPVMIYDTVNGQAMLRYPGIVPNRPARQHAGRRHCAERLRGADSAAERFHGRRRWDGVGRQLGASVGTHPRSERRRLLCRQRGHGFRPKWHRGLAGQLPLPVGVNERVRAGSQLAQPGGAPLVPIGADGGAAAAPGGVGGAVTSDSEFGPYSGANGLGQQAAWGQTVRPFRRLISCQAIFRREVFQ